MKTRNRRLIASCLLLMLMAGGFRAYGENISDAFVDGLFTANKVVSAQVVIVKGDQPVYVRSHGFRDAKKQKPATIDTKYVIASVTKMVSAVGLMRLYDQGWFGLDEPIEDALGYPVINTQYRQSITIRQLLSHTTGLKQGNTYKGNWSVLSKSGSMYYFNQNTPPGSAYEYSNRNGGLIGSLIEAMSGLSLNTYMRANLFEPLGIDAAYSADLLKDQTNISYRLNTNGTPMASDETLIKQGRDYDDTCSPAAHQGNTIGRLVISAPDLAKIGTMLKNRGQWMGETILEEETVEEMEADQDELPGSSVTWPGPYGLCLERVRDSFGHTWYGHQGRAYGLTSDVFYQPELDLTVVVIGNGYSAKKRDTLVTLFADIMDRAAQTDWDQMPACGYEFKAE